MLEMLSRTQLEQMTRAELIAHLAEVDNEIERLKAQQAVNVAAAVKSEAAVQEARARLNNAEVAAAALRIMNVHHH